MGYSGGFIVVPILLTYFEYTAKEAVQLSFVILLFSGISYMINALPKKTKDNVPLLDYDLIVISLPLSSIGSIFGTLLRNFFPALLL